MKIKAYLALFAAAVLLPVIFFSGYALKQLLNEEREAMFMSMRELARATVLSVDKEFTYGLAAAQTLSTSVLLANGDFEGFYKQAVAANRTKDIYTALIDENGQQVFNTVIPFGEKIPPPSAINRKRVQEVIDGYSIQISNLIVESKTGRHVIGIEIPVRLRDGRRYVVTEWMYASHLNSVLPRMNIPETWLIAIYDRNGTIAGRSFNPEKFVGSLPVPELHELVLSRERQQFQLPNKEGINTYGVIDWSKLSGWSVAVGVPEVEFEEAARKAVMMAGLGLLAAILVAIGAAWFFSHRLIQAINSAKQSAILLGQNGVPEVKVSDVKEVSELHKALHEAGKKLEVTEAARATHLKEAQEARSQAEMQNAAKDEFLAMLGHELRNPLAAIVSGVDLLGWEGAGPEVGQRAQEIIARQSRHLTSLVDDLLDAHRIMSRKVSLTMQSVRLDEVVLSCLDGFQARNAGVHHTIHIETEPAWIYADSTRLEQMVANLFENALKYTPEGGSIEVAVSVENNTAIFYIKDTGIGIAPELLPEIFNAFTQGQVVNRSKGGLGLGLAVTKSLALQQEAELTAESPGPGQGSKFTLRFTLAKAATATFAVPALVREANPIKILVIEDNNDLREMVCAMLTMSGHTVLNAPDGETGLKLALKEQPDVALVDIDLPGISGFEVAARLRANKVTCGMKLIAVTGYGQEADKIKALNSGFDVHLRKPVEMTELAKLLFKANL